MLKFILRIVSYICVAVVAAKSAILFMLQTKPEMSSLRQPDGCLLAEASSQSGSIALSSGMLFAFLPWACS